MRADQPDERVADVDRHDPLPRAPRTRLTSSASTSSSSSTPGRRPSAATPSAPSGSGSTPSSSRRRGRRTRCRPAAAAPPSRARPRRRGDVGGDQLHPVRALEQQPARPARALDVARGQLEHVPVLGRDRRRRTARSARAPPRARPSSAARGASARQRHRACDLDLQQAGGRRDALRLDPLDVGRGPRDRLLDGRSSTSAPRTGSRCTRPRAAGARRRRRRRSSSTPPPCATRYGRTSSSAPRTRSRHRHRVQPVQQQQVRDELVLDRHVEPAATIRASPSPYMSSSACTSSVATSRCARRERPRPGPAAPRPRSIIRAPRTSASAPA